MRLIFSGMALEQTLRAAREDKGWSRVELAKRTGLTTQTIYLLETGQVRKPNVDTALKLAEALGRPVEALFASGDSSDVVEKSTAVPPATRSTDGTPAPQRDTAGSVADGEADAPTNTQAGTR
jgi:DNA-binding XRE family transcriptional regulator